MAVDRCIVEIRAMADLRPSINDLVELVVGAWLEQKLELGLELEGPRLVLKA